MGKSTEDLIRELETSGVLGSSPGGVPAAGGARPPVGLPPAAKRGSSLLYIVLAAVLVGIVGSVPFGQDLLYPFSLFVTLVHETSHALAATATGGQVQRIAVSPDLSGVTVTRGGWQWLIAPTGYLGATIVGAALLVTRLRYARWAFGLLTVVPLLALVLFHPGSFFTVAWAVAYVAALGGVAWKLSGRALEFLLVLLGVESGLNAFRDLTTLFLLSTSRADIQTDAVNMARVVPLPSTFWAISWTVLSVLILSGALLRVVRRERRGG